MSAELIQTISREARRFKVGGPVERIPPPGRQVLFYSAEPETKLDGPMGHIPSHPEWGRYHQLAAQSHGMHPRFIHTVPVHDLTASMPDIHQINRFAAGVWAGGSGSLVTEGGLWQARFRDSLREIAYEDLALLATCFSMQSLIVALGGEVNNNASGERKFGVGKYTRTAKGKKHWFLRNVPDNFLAFRSHIQDSKRLPEDVDVLAIDSEDGSIAAIGYRDYTAGVQFHTDIDLRAMIGLSQTESRRREIQASGRTHDQIIRELVAAEKEVIATQLIINGNFLQRMHERPQLVYQAALS